MTSLVDETKRQSWSICIFCFNEEMTLGDVAREAARVAQILSGGASWEVIIVDDGSSDRSGAIADQLHTEVFGIRVIHHPQNLGIGEALASAYEAASFENVVTIPADGQFDVCELLPFATIPERTLVSFARTRQVGYTLARKLLSSANRFYNRALLGLRMKDVNWIKVYKRSDLKSIRIQLRSSLIESEICGKFLNRGVSLMEIPSIYHDRRGGVSKAVSGKLLVKVFREVWQLSQVILKDKKAIRNDSRQSSHLLRSL